jgi:hypothetical protein
MNSPAHEHVFGPHGCWCGAKPTEKEYQAYLDRLIKEHDAAFLAKHRVIVDKFLEIAERKIAPLDDYAKVAFRLQ